MIRTHSELDRQDLDNKALEFAAFIRNAITIAKRIPNKLGDMGYHEVWGIRENAHMLRSILDPKTGFANWPNIALYVKWLGAKRCAQIGKNICKEQGFTRKDANDILAKYPLPEYTRDYAYLPRN